MTIAQMYSAEADYDFDLKRTKRQVLAAGVSLAEWNRWQYLMDAFVQRMGFNSGAHVRRVALRCVADHLLRIERDPK